VGGRLAGDAGSDAADLEAVGLMMAGVSQMTSDQ
jgi:hypothetical protein